MQTQHKHTHNSREQNKMFSHIAENKEKKLQNSLTGRE
jgi:hypothetical protein